MSLNIKNEKVHDLVRQLAELTGQSQTSAVEDAVRRRLEEVSGAREAEIARRRGAIDRIVARARDTSFTWADYEKIIDDMYDENGLPR
ncbi:type II toxin-antitoxin system VapB family antitoxin [Microbacterium alcoholitolerans]|uniref:type II toxin-antitoxin system VapB family antitoxin n=1 Tax=unclassified Microbacterium TaxID=2609290 RepID=UPI003D16D55B